MPMPPEDYLKDRLDDQLAWYEAKSASCQNSYKRLRLLEISAAALIPFLSGMGETLGPAGNWIIGGLGVMIALATGAMSLNKYHENWIQYRATAEQLKQERFFFLTGSGPYADDTRLSSLVQRVEALLSKENSSWAQVAASKEKPQADQAPTAG